jgi:2-C-methyl-D-erythritol 4-phosphate cytidylyltransferase
MSRSRYWAVIPAAGTGSRVGADIPKQYLSLCGRTVLEHTLSRICSHPEVESVVVVITRGDKYWPQLDFSTHPKVCCADGGNERVYSVLNGLDVIARTAEQTDWVLVHDAARPCIRVADINRLMSEAGKDPVGGLLALPVRDTLKRSDVTGSSEATVDRTGLWQALTPQMFRLGELRNAIQSALNRGLLVTDEAQAMELSGLHPKLVQGSPDNIKITLQADLKLAELYLRAQLEEPLCA